MIPLSTLRSHGETRYAVFYLRVRNGVTPSFDECVMVRNACATSPISIALWKRYAPLRNAP